MENVRSTDANTASPQSCCAPAAKSGWLNSRNLIIGVTAVGSAAAMFFGWDWLVAAGVATFIVALAPCLAMCALGLCASRMGRKGAAPALPPKEAQPPAVETVANSEPAAEMVANVQLPAVEKAKSA